MPVVDPNAEKWKSKGQTQKTASGTHTFFTLGHERFKINNNDVVGIRSVCVESADPNQIGSELEDVIWLHTETALSRLVKFVSVGLGHNEPFDTDSDEDLAQIIGRNPFFRAKIKTSKVPGNDGGEFYRQDAGWNYTAAVLPRDPVTGARQVTEEQQQVIQAAIKRFAGYVSWRQANPHNNSGGGSPQRGSGNRSRNQSSDPMDPVGGDLGSESYDYDDVPF